MILGVNTPIPGRRRRRGAIVALVGLVGLVGLVVAAALVFQAARDDTDVDQRAANGSTAGSAAGLSALLAVPDQPPASASEVPSPTPPADPSPAAPSTSPPPAASPVASPTPDSPPSSPPAPTGGGGFSAPRARLGSVGSCRQDPQGSWVINFTYTVTGVYHEVSWSSRSRDHLTGIEVGRKAHPGSVQRSAVAVVVFGGPPPADGTPFTAELDVRAGPPGVNHGRLYSFGQIGQTAGCGA
jgi:hypothetical protein